MTLDGQLIGQNMFMKAVIAADDGRSIPIMTMGRSVLHRSLKGRGMERFYWIILWKKQKSLDAEQYALKEILIFMEKADLNGKRVWHPLSWIAGRRGCIFLSVQRTDTGIS